MSIESELKRLFDSDASAPPGIDLSLVIRRSRRRHVAAQVAVGGATTLAVVGIGVASVAGLRSLGSPSPSTGSAAAPSTASDSPGMSQSRAAAGKINLCGGPLATVAPNPSGLVLTAHFPAGSASAPSVSGTVTLTNTGTERIVGSTAATPAITLSRDGVTLWHSNGPAAAMAAIVDLLPGASMTYPASFTPVICGAEDDLGDSFRSDLPHVVPGEYQVSAAIDLSRRASSGLSSIELVTGSVSTVILN